MIIYGCGAAVRRWFHLYSLAKDEVSEGGWTGGGKGKVCFCVYISFIMFVQQGL